MAQDLGVWMKDALPYLPGAIQEVVKRELILTARDFFERTYAWRESFSDVSMVSGDTEYDLATYFPDEQVLAPLAVAYGRDTTSRPFLTPLPIKHPSAKVSTDPTHYYISDVPSKVKLWPQPDNTVTEALVFYVALTPKQTATSLPDIAADRFYDALLDGLLSRMFAQTGKTYTDKAMAMQRRTSFLTAIGRFKAYGKQGYAQGQNWTYPAGWGVPNPSQ